MNSYMCSDCEERPAERGATLCRDCELERTKEADEQEAEYTREMQERRDQATMGRDLMYEEERRHLDEEERQRAANEFYTKDNFPEAFEEEKDNIQDVVDRQHQLNKRDLTYLEALEEVKESYPDLDSSVQRRLATERMH